MPSEPTAPQPSFQAPTPVQEAVYASAPAPVTPPPVEQAQPPAPVQEGAVAESAIEP